MDSKPVVDIVIEKGDKIVLLKRSIEPFKGKWIIPGGHVEYGETVETAAVRESEEETSLKVRLKEILGVYSDKNRDPRYHTISTAFIAEAVAGELRVMTEAKEAKWVTEKEIDFDSLGFDHKKILKDYFKWKKEKGTYWSTKV